MNSKNPPVPSSSWSLQVTRVQDQTNGFQPSIFFANSTLFGHEVCKRGLHHWRYKQTIIVLILSKTSREPSLNILVPQDLHFTWKSKSKDISLLYKLWGIESGASSTCLVFTSLTNSDDLKWLFQILFIEYIFQYGLMDWHKEEMRNKSCNAL